MEKYSRGRRGAPAKGVDRVTGARVQISPSPPKINHRTVVYFFQRVPHMGFAPEKALACQVLFHYIRVQRLRTLSAAGCKEFSQ